MGKQTVQLNFLLFQRLVLFNLFFVLPKASCGCNFLNVPRRLLQGFLGSSFQFILFLSSDLCSRNKGIYVSKWVIYKKWNTQLLLLPDSETRMRTGIYILPLKFQNSFHCFNAKWLESTLGFLWKVLRVLSAKFRFHSKTTPTFLWVFLFRYVISIYNI